VLSARTVDHDDFGLIQSKIMNVIDSKDLERDAGGKPVPTFPHPALARLSQLGHLSSNFQVFYVENASRYKGR
jgi:hypothetical protein